MKTLIETDRLELTEWREEDMSAFATMSADAEVMRYFPAVLTREESDAFVQRIVNEMQAKGYGLFAAREKVSGRFMGYVGLHEIAFDAGFQGEMEIGWRLDKAFWNQGYATEAARAVLGFARSIGLKRILSFTAAINIPSERVMRKIGMRKIRYFNHPALDVCHPLCRHVLYAIEFK